jgi:hypothetical protein
VHRAVEISGAGFKSVVFCNHNLQESPPERDLYLLF